MKQLLLPFSLTSSDSSTVHDLSENNCINKYSPDLNKIIEGLPQNNTVDEKRRISGKKARDEGIRFEKTFFESLGGSVKNNIHVGSLNNRKKTLSKVDGYIELPVLVKSQIHILKKVSIKNSEGTTQVHVTSAANLINYMEYKTNTTIDAEVKSALKKFLGDFEETKTSKNFKNNPDFFNNLMREKYDIEASNLDYLESKCSRLRTSNIPEIESLIGWIEQNKSSLVEYFLSTGRAKNTEDHSDCLIYCSKKNSIKDPIVFMIRDIIDDSVNWPIEIGEGESQILLGPLNIKMKGSGENHSSYHSLQVTLSRSKLEHYIKPAQVINELLDPIQ